MAAKEAGTAAREAGTAAKEATAVMPMTTINPALTSSRRLPPPSCNTFGIPRLL